MQLKDQAAIVTGGASGLGAATARRLAAQGAKVAVCDLNANACRNRRRRDRRRRRDLRRLRCHFAEAAVAKAAAAMARRACW
jgi:NAD(P)-dependent dehydrogenase (short-subunit alcohol dehydrogenase family)